MACSCGVVLLYHRIAKPLTDAHGLCVSPEQFAEQSRYLARTCVPLALNELVALATKNRLPKRAVAVTFDDGYADSIGALETLLEQRIPVTLFMTTAELEHREPYYYWWDIVEDAVLGDKSPAGNLKLSLPDGDRCFAVSTDAERRLAHQAIHGVLLTMDEPGRRTALASLDESTTRARDIPRRMNMDELRALEREPGVSIGAHGEYHLALPSHSSDRQRREIESSRLTLERLLSHPISAFAYPYGRCSTTTMELVRRAGFGMAMTATDGAVLPTTSRHAMPRLNVKSDSLHQFIKAIEDLLAE